MFIVYLKFADNRQQAGEYMDGHNAWIKQGFEDGVFLLVGSLQPGLGGAIIAHNTDADELDSRIRLDPFVVEGVVSAEIHEINPAKTDDRLNFLLN